MIIECNGCSRKFNLKDDLLKPQGSKVRCTKCGTIFMAVPPAAADRTPENKHGCSVPNRQAPAAGETKSQAGTKKPQRIALSVPVSCISIDAEDRPLNFYIGLITEVGPSDLCVEVFCSTVPDSVMVSFINLENRDVQIKATVVRSETTPSRKTKLELSLMGAHQETTDFIAQLVKSYHYSN
jgi:predicted Zn finger-like uncharacterized protein